MSFVTFTLQCYVLYYTLLISLQSVCMQLTHCTIINAIKNSMENIYIL